MFGDSHTVYPNNSLRRLSPLVEPPRGDSQDQTSNPRRGQCFVPMLTVLGDVGGVGTRIGNWSRATAHL